MSITVEELRARAQKWTAPISDTAPAGALATFDPEYEKVRAEIAKRDSPSAGKVVWRTVLESGTDILENKSKDLVIASYVAFGLFTERGLDGLVTGCAILAEIIGTYWPGMFPELKRIRGRVSALTWFIDAVGNTLPSYQVTSVDRPAVEALAVASKRLAEVAREKFLDNTPAMRPLVDTAQQLLMSLPEEAPTGPDPVGPPPVAPPPVAPLAAPPPKIAPPPVAAAPAASAPVAVTVPMSMPSVQAAPPADATEVVNFARQVGSTLVDAGNTLRGADITAPYAYRLVRVGAWLPLVDPPPVEGGKTRVPGPQPSVRAQLEKIAQNGKWAALIEECESAVSAARFWLDIQRYTATALANLGPAHARARDEVIRETALFLKRFPDIVGYQFADGTAFADAETQAWIAREVSGALGSSGGNSTATSVVVTVAGGRDSSAGADEGADVADEARKLAGEGKVAEALALLQGRVHTSGSAAGKFRARLVLGQVCLGAGQVGLARAVYEALEKDVSAHGLEAWEPSLAAASAEGLLNCHRALAKGGKPLPTDSGLLYDRLCRLDPTAALRLGA